MASAEKERWVGVLERPGPRISTASSDFKKTEYTSNWSRKMKDLASSLPDPPAEMLAVVAAQQLAAQGMDHLAQHGGADVDLINWLHGTGMILRAMYECPLTTMEVVMPPWEPVFKNMSARRDLTSNTYPPSYRDAAFMTTGVAALVTCHMPPLFATGLAEQMGRMICMLKSPAERERLDARMAHTDTDLKMIHILDAFLYPFVCGALPHQKGVGGPAFVASLGEDAFALAKALIAADVKRARSWRTLAQLSYLCRDYQQAYSAYMNSGKLAKAQGMDYAAASAYMQALNCIKLGVKGPNYYLSDVLPIINDVEPMLARSQVWAPKALWTELQQSCEVMRKHEREAARDGIPPNEKKFSTVAYSLDPKTRSPYVSIPQCVVCGNLVATTKFCSRCRDKGRQFCSKECQAIDWKNGHKAVCKPAEGKPAKSPR